MTADKYAFTKYKQWKMDSANPADEFRACLKVPHVEPADRESFLGTSQSRALKLDDATGRPVMFRIHFELLPAPDDQFLLQFKLKLDGDEQEEAGMWRHGARVYSGHSSTAEEIVGIGTIFAPTHDGILWKIVASAERIAEFFKDGHINFRFELKRDRVIKRQPTEEPEAEEIPPQEHARHLNGGPYGDGAAVVGEAERAAHAEMVAELQAENQALVERMENLRADYFLLECERNTLEADCTAKDKEREQEQLGAEAMVADLEAELQAAREALEREKAEAEARLEAIQQEHASERAAQDVRQRESDERNDELRKLQEEREQLRVSLEKQAKERDFLIEQINLMRQQAATNNENADPAKSEEKSQGSERALKRKIDELTVQQDELVHKCRALEVEKERYANVLERLWEQRQRAHGTDLRLLVGEKNFEVHKLVLMLASGFFERKFTEEPTVAELPLEDLKEEEAEWVLEFLYRGILPAEHTVRLFELASRFEIDALKVACLQPLKSSLTAENVADRLVLAELHDSAELAAACFQFVERSGRDRIVLLGEPAMGRLIESPKPTDTDLFRRIYRAMKKTD